MKSTESKTTTASQTHHSGQAPFFQQEASKAVLDGEHQFFGGSPAPFFQPKLTIGAPDDPYEREADATAEKVVQRLALPDAPALSEPVHSIQRMPAPVQRACAECQQEEQKEAEEQIQEKVQLKTMAETPVDGEGDMQRKTDNSSENTAQPGHNTTSEHVQTAQSSASSVNVSLAESQPEEKLQKKEDEEPLQEKVQRKPIFDAPSETEGTLQRKCDDCEQEDQGGVQRQADGAIQTSAPANFSAQLQSSKGGGSALPAEVSAQMGQALGADFSGVRVHTGSEAAEMSQSIQAQAFTHGSDIYFNEGKYDTGSTGGQKLLAHELTHTVQQGGAEQMVQRVPTQRINTQTLESNLLTIETLIEYYFPSEVTTLRPIFQSQRDEISTLNSSQFRQKLETIQLTRNRVEQVIGISDSLPPQGSRSGTPQVDGALQNARLKITAFLRSCFSENEATAFREVIEAKNTYLNEYVSLIISTFLEGQRNLPTMANIDSNTYFIDGYPQNGVIVWPRMWNERDEFEVNIDITREQMQRIGSGINSLTPDQRIDFIAEHGDDMMRLLRKARALSLIEISFMVGQTTFEKIIDSNQQTAHDIFELQDIKRVIRELLQEVSNGDPSDDSIDRQRRRLDFGIQFANDRLQQIAAFETRLQIFVTIASTLVGLGAMTYTSNALRGAAFMARFGSAQGVVRFTISSLAFTSASTATRVALTGQVPTAGQFATQAGLDLATMGILHGSQMLVGLRYGGVARIPAGVQLGTAFTTLWAWSSTLAIIRDDQPLSLSRSAAIIGETALHTAIELPIIVFAAQALGIPKLGRNITERNARRIIREWDANSTRIQELGQQLRTMQQRASRNSGVMARTIGNIIEALRVAQNKLTGMQDVGLLTGEQGRMVRSKIAEQVQAGINLQEAFRLNLTPAGGSGYFYSGSMENVGAYLNRLQTQGLVTSIEFNPTNRVIQANFQGRGIMFFFPEGANPRSHVVDITDFSGEAIVRVASSLPARVHQTALSNLRILPAADVSRIAAQIEHQSALRMVEWLARPGVNGLLNLGDATFSRDLIQSMLTNPNVFNQINSENPNAIALWRQSSLSISNYQNIGGFLQFLDRIRLHRGNLDISTLAEAQIAIENYNNQTSASSFVPGNRPSSIGVSGSTRSRDIHDYFIDNQISGNFTRVHTRDGSWIIIEQSGQLTRSIYFRYGESEPSQEINLVTELSNVDSLVNQLESVQTSATRRALLARLRQHYDRLSFISNLRLPPSELASTFSLLQRANLQLNPEASLELPTTWREGNAGRPPILPHVIVKLRQLNVANVVTESIFRNISSSRGLNASTFLGTFNLFLARALNASISTTAANTVIHGLATMEVFSSAQYLVERGGNSQPINHSLFKFSLSEIGRLRSQFRGIPDNEFILYLDAIARRANISGPEIITLISELGPQGLDRLYNAVERLGDGSFSMPQIQESLDFGRQLQDAINTRAGSVANLIWGNKLQGTDANGRLLVSAQLTNRASGDLARAFINPRRAEISAMLLGGEGGTELSSVNWGVFLNSIRNTDLPVLAQNNIIGEVWAFARVQMYKNRGYHVVREVRIHFMENGQISNRFAILDAVLRRGTTLIYKEFKSSQTASTSPEQILLYDLLARGNRNTLHPTGANAIEAFGGDSMPLFQAQAVEFDRP